MSDPIRISRLGVVNAYLVAEEDGLTVIDTAIRGSHKAILAAAAKLGRPITRIALTHAHTDHVGGLDALAAAVPNAEVAIGARDARLLQKDKSMDPGEPDVPPKGGFLRLSTVPGTLLQPGDLFGSLEVHAAPGHTPGQVAFLDPRDGTLFCGDAYATLGGVATCAKANPRFPLPALATWHKPTALRTARELRALEPRALAPGHGKVVADPGAQMDAAIALAAG